MNADLIAVVIAVNGEPRVLTIGRAGVLPSGPFEPDHRSLQSGLRAWVERQIGHPLGYIEQLYTFADRDRIGNELVQRVISISYLGLTREELAERSPTHGWYGWYDYFPWEDHRAGVPSILPDILLPGLQAWADEAGPPGMRDDRRQRVELAFGLDDRNWNEELALQRYELLYEAALVPEATRGRDDGNPSAMPGRPMTADHRRILATGIARLRTKIKYRPVVFELMPIGDWAKGEFAAAGKVAGQDYLCQRFPGTDGSVIYLSDVFAMFDVPESHKAAQKALASAIMSKDVQVDFNLIKGSVPARTDVSDEKFDVCGKKGIADLKAASADGKLLGSLALTYGAPPAISNVYKDVVSKFIHGQITTSDQAVTELVKAIDDAR